MAPLRAYFVECYSEPYYLWIFCAFVLYGLNNAGNQLKINYTMNELHLSWDLVGKLNSAPLVIAVLLGYFIGSMTDRIHPVRLFPWLNFAWALTCLGSYIFIKGAWSYFIWISLTQIAIFAYQVAFGALLPEIYPREKLGQFCSACVLLQIAVGFILQIPIGEFWDWLNFDRFAYIWSAVFLFGAGLVWLKVLDNYNKRHCHVPVPHAG